MSLAAKGKPKSLEHRLKISQIMKNKIGEKAPAWKGDKVGYFGLHEWIRKYKGKPTHCEKCGKNNLFRLEWANLSKEYKRDLNDWISLCKPCHSKFDNVLEKSWKTRRKIKCMN